MNEIVRKCVLKYIFKHVGQKNISDQYFLKQDVGLDSISTIVILTDIAEELEINIFDGDTTDFMEMITINDLYHALEKRIK